MDATPTACPAHHLGSVSGSIQVGPARLVIEAVEPNRYGEGQDGIHYRVEANIVSHWGARPLPGAVYTYTRGISPASSDELRDQVETCYGVGRSEGALLSYRGKMAGFPYRSAISDEQAKWLRTRGVEIIGTGAAITLTRGDRTVDVHADGTAKLAGEIVTAREAVTWLVAA